MVCGLKEYDIYEGLENHAISNYLKNREISRIRLVAVSGIGMRAVYTIEITEEEALFIMLSIPDITVKKCKSKINI